MTRRKIDQRLIAEDVEELSVAKLKKAFKRFKNDTSKFRSKNVRDPIDHLDFELNLDNELLDLKNRIDRGDYHPKRPLIHYSPKKNGISRPTVSLHIEDSIVYRFCVESIDKELIAITRQKNIRGGVMASPVSKPEDGEYYEKWFEDWLAHNKAVKDALERHEYIATSDISSYFDNIDVEVLIDMLREVVKDKRNLISLLSLFLHGIKLRYTYATRLNTGLVQDDSDSSRILAYFYLHPHDIRMINFSKQKDGFFFRFVDDMNVIVKTKTDAKLALKALTDSLRKLGLTASIEKTSIVKSDVAAHEMRYAENEEIQKLQDSINKRLRKGGQTKLLKQELESLYSEYKTRGLDNEGSWIKLLKRFYTLATHLKADFLLDEATTHLIDYPGLAATGKLYRYIIANQSSPKFEVAVSDIIAYCNSSENLYPQVETALIELLSNINLANCSVALQVLAEDLAYRMFKLGWKGSKTSLSEFSQGLSAYLLYNCDPSYSREIGMQYVQTNEQSEYARKCWALVGLTCQDMSVRKAVIKKLKAETSDEMKRLSFMIVNLKDLKKKAVLKRYKGINTFYLWSEEWADAAGQKQRKKIELRHVPIRTRIIKDILKANR